MTAASCTRSSASPAAAPGRASSGHGVTISRVVWNCDQISSVTCGITGCRRTSSSSSAASAVAIAASSAA